MEHISRIEPHPRLKLTEARKAHAFSQQDVAERIGTTHVNVSRWERGITTPGPYYCRKLCRLFGKTLQELDLVNAASFSEQTATPEENESSDIKQARKISAVLSVTYTTKDPIIDPAIPALSSVRLIGREEEITRIKQTLSQERQGRITALNGLPGVGKTSLAISLAHDQDVRGHFYDGILWAGLGPHPGLTSHLNRWGGLLGLSSTELLSLDGNDARARALHNAIGARSLLLIIDDVWSAEDALLLKVGGVNCVHLVTTRFPEVATSVSVDGLLIEELDEQESITLLRDLAPRVVDGEMLKAIDLVQSVGGLPLALALIGNYLRKQSESGQTRRVTTALQRLRSAKERLQLQSITDATQTHAEQNVCWHPSLQSVIAMTDQQLAEPARMALYKLSILPAKPNSFSEETALAVISCQVDVLDTLVDAGILESYGTNRYTLHQTIRDYAYERLLTTSDENTAYRSLILYVVSLLENKSNAYDMLEEESAVIITALKKADELGMQSELIRSVTAYIPYCQLRGFYALAEQHLQHAEQAAIAMNDAYYLSLIHLYMGQVLQQQGKFNEAEANFQQGLVLARRLSNLERVSAFLHSLGWIAWKLGNYSQAETYLQEGLRIAREIDDKKRVSSILTEIGSVASLRGEYHQANMYLRESLDIAHQLDDYEKAAIKLLMHLGFNAGQQGDHHQAAQYFQDGLRLAHQIGHRESICGLLVNLGAAKSELGEYEQAERYFQEGLEVAHQIGHREWQSILLLNLGETSIAQNHILQAETHLHNALILSREIGRPQIIAKVLYEYGNVQLKKCEVHEAQTAFDEMLMNIPEGDKELKSLAYYGQARIAAVRGDVLNAVALGEQCAKDLEDIGHGSAQEVRTWLERLLLNTH